MPKFDGTGPLGCGPLTGRGLGNCRYNCGCGRRRFLTREEELGNLEEEAKEIEEELKAIRERITELKK